MNLIMLLLRHRDGSVRDAIEYTAHHSLFVYIVMTGELHTGPQPLFLNGYIKKILQRAHIRLMLNMDL